MTKIKKNTALVLTQLSLSEQQTAPSKRFIDLLKACDIEVDISSTITDSNRAKAYDCIMLDSMQSSATSDISEYILSITSDTNVVLFNADEQSVCESSALFSGMKGIFYQGDRPDLILKGLESILNNEPWFKRATMSKAITDLLKLTSVPQSKQAILATDINLPKLTKREKMIVNLVSSGAQNKEIAEQLHISPNTVKTHIYSLFRKTSSRNRIELITWSQQFIPTYQPH